MSQHLKTCVDLTATESYLLLEAFNILHLNPVDVTNEVALDTGINHGEWQDKEEETVSKIQTVRKETPPYVEKR